MGDRKLILDALGPSLKEAGFKKQAGNWYRSNDEIILMVNIQKSQYGDQYYINIGIALKSLGVVQYPKEHNCHIRFRLTALVKEDEKKHIDSIFDLENKSFSETQRTEEICMLVQNILLPTLKECSSEQEVLELVKRNKFVNGMVHVKIKNLV